MRMPTYAAMRFVTSIPLLTLSPELHWVTHSDYPQLNVLHSNV